jgi:vacuolar-type H+-ATPase subunit F/Vma7
MMAILRAIVGPVLATGFRLAGLTVDEATSAPQAAALLQRLAQRPDTGVVLMQQDWFDLLPEAQRRVLDRAPVPVVVPIPAADWSGGRSGAEEYILDLLQRAIGYRVRLQ